MKALLAAWLFAVWSGMASGAVNLNTATKDELVELPGIGPAKAQAIIDYRTANGPFKSVEQLKDVKGIGAKRFEKLKPDLTVAPPPAKAAAGRADATPPRGSRGDIAATGGAKRDAAAARP
jgi:competence protein ComEA